MPTRIVSRVALGISYFLLSVGLPTKTSPEISLRIFFRIYQKKKIWNVYTYEENSCRISWDESSKNPFKDSFSIFSECIAVHVFLWNISPGILLDIHLWIPSEFFLGFFQQFFKKFLQKFHLVTGQRIFSEVAPGISWGIQWEIPSMIAI